MRAAARTPSTTSGWIFSRNHPPSTPARDGRDGSPDAPPSSCPTSASQASTRSSSEPAIGPGQSIDGASGITPSSGSAPCVGFNPPIPQNDDGIRIEPPVSVPSAIGTIPAATAAPDPPLEPPVIRVMSHGFAVGPHAETRLVPPAASSCMFVLPTTIAPAAFSRRTTAASVVARFPM